jgi:hypothetical protein
MMEASRAIAVIPSEHFRWRARVQFQESFRTRDQALNYAFERGYNLIVEHEEGKGLQYDVLYDPDQLCTSGLNLESVETEDFLAEPEPIGWTILMVSSIVNLISWFAAALAVRYRRHVVPFSRHTAFVARRRYREVAPRVRRSVNRRWQDVERAIRRGWRARADWGAADLTRRSAAFARLCLRRAEPASRRAVALAHSCLRELVPLSRRAAAAAGPRLREMVAICRRATIAAWKWLRETAVRLETGARREWPNIRRNIRQAYVNLRWDASGLDSKSQAVVASLYRGKIAPAFRTAASRLRWADVEGSIQRPGKPQAIQLHFPFS